MIAADWGYAIPAAMVTAGGLWFTVDIVLDVARTIWMDIQIRRDAAQIVEGAGAGDRPRTAATPSTPNAEPVALPVHPEASHTVGAPFDSGISIYDWATSDPWLTDPPAGADLLAGGTDEEAALADINRRFHAIVRAESMRQHPANRGTVA